MTSKPRARPIPLVLYEALFLDFCNELRAHLRGILTDDEVAAVFKPDSRQLQIESLQQAGAKYDDPYSVVDHGAFRQLVLTYRKKLVPQQASRAIDERNWASLNEHFKVIMNIRNTVAHPTDSNCPAPEAAIAAIESAIAVLDTLGLNSRELKRYLTELASSRPRRRQQPSGRFALPRPGPIFGRSRELVQLREMLAPGKSRIVTITGQGGVGKTRLAIAAAAAVATDYSQVLFVDLVGVKTWIEGRRLLGQAVGIPSESIGALEEALSGERRLIVMDNFEHLVRDGAKALGAILRTAEGTTALVTSVERLGLQSESILQLTALEPPRTDDSTGDLAANPAVALFIARVARGRGRYHPRSKELADIAEICRRVDGLPLALSIAAGHAVDRPVGLVLSNLDRFLASRSETDAPDRHQTMKACLDWSWNLLTKDERAVLRRSSYLLLGGSSETIREVCSFAGLSKERVDSGIAGLVRRSLMELDGERYRLPELVRQYATDQLTDFEVRRVVVLMFLQATSLVNKLLQNTEGGDEAERQEALVQAVVAQTLLIAPTIAPSDVVLRFLIAVARGSSDVFVHWRKLLLDQFEKFASELPKANPRIAAEAAVEMARLRIALGMAAAAEASAALAVQQAVQAGFEDVVLGATATFTEACRGRTGPRRKLSDILGRQPVSRAGLLAMSQLSLPGYPRESEGFDWDFAISGLCRVGRLWLRHGSVEEAERTLDEVEFAITAFDLPERHRLEALRLGELMPNPRRRAQALVTWAEFRLGLDDVPALHQLRPEGPHLVDITRQVLLQSRKVLIGALKLAPLVEAATLLALVEIDLGHTEDALESIQIAVRERALDGDQVMLVARLSALILSGANDDLKSRAVWLQVLRWGENWLRSNGNRMSAFALASVERPKTRSRRALSTLSPSERAMAVKSVDGLSLAQVFGFMEAEVQRIENRRSAEASSDLVITVHDKSD